jgi:hypothetical protein
MAASCGDSDETDLDRATIAWVSPAVGAAIQVDEPIELSVKVADHDARMVSFVVDGKALATCDVSNGPDECKRDDRFRTTTAFPTAGIHRLLATAHSANGTKLEVSVSITVVDRAVEDVPVADAGVSDAAHDAADAAHASDAGGDGALVRDTKRGFLDPDRALHNFNDGVSWSVLSQRVSVVSPPSGNVANIAACMKTYGASIRKHADANKVSRASVVATAITESSCTNPTGSSDGLSSGPMQVTGSTCASVAKGYTSAACKTKMHDDPDFSFSVGAQYMGSRYQLTQHDHDPPKISAAYNAGSVRKSTANRWHMLVTGNHLERWVAAYNAYRQWESMTGAAKLALDAAIASRPVGFFAGEHVTSVTALPDVAVEGQTVFVGDWNRRDGAFVQFRDGAWQSP